ncbi:MAG: hypothetical protein GF381_02300 [Candidatus Pacebacteria bacterium]|nr:hypothetical protein [Candidatus Paceibacterota bacterium]
MHQVICIGSALVDIYIHSQEFKTQPSPQGELLCQLYGDKLEVDSFSVYTGGGASNTAVGFARMGFKTGIVCETGRDKFSYLVTEDLRQEDVDLSLVIEEKKEQTGGSVILVGPDGERSIMVHRGASSLLDPYDIPSYWLSQSRWVHLSSIAGRQETLAKIFELVDRQPELSLSWNPGKQELLLLENGQLQPEQVSCQVLFLNRREWQMISNVQAQLLRKVPQIVVTDGERGGDVYSQGEHLLHYQAITSQTRDTTGAGDSFSVGFVSGQLLNKSIEQSVEMGGLNAASVVQYYGAKPGLLSREELVK